MRDVRYRVNLDPDRFPDEHPGDTADLEVDEVQRDYPMILASWAEQDPMSWNGTDPEWLDRVALAAAYSDPDRAWRLAADAIRATHITEIQGYGFLGADVEARIPHAVQLAIDVLSAIVDSARLARAVSRTLTIAEAKARRADLVALARLRALASVEDISLEGIDAEAAQ